MATQGIEVVLELGPRRPREWVRSVIRLLDVAIGELKPDHSAKDAILQAASLLREQIDPQAAAGAIDEAGRLLAWQARRVREYVDARIAGPILVTDLSALIQRSEAHFSRAFKRTFGVSPHAFIIRRRVELAAQYMLESDVCLADIALRCGFTDQAHFCKRFRQATGERPGSWRRAHRKQSFGYGAAGPSGEGMVRKGRPIEQSAMVAA